MLSKRSSCSEQFDNDEDDDLELEKSNPWNLENLLPDEQVIFTKKILRGISKSFKLVDVKSQIRCEHCLRELFFMLASDINSNTIN